MMKSVCKMVCELRGRGMRLCVIFAGVERVKLCISIFGTWQKGSICEPGLSGGRYHRSVRVKGWWSVEDLQDVVNEGKRARRVG